MNKKYKVTVSMDEYKTEVEDCESKDEALNIVLNNEVLGGGLLNFEIEESSDEPQAIDDYYMSIEEVSDDEWGTT